MCLLWCVSLRRCKALLVCTRVFQCVFQCHESFNVSFNADPHKKHLNTLKNESFNVSFQGFFSVLRSFLCGSLLLCLFNALPVCMGLFWRVSLRLFKAFTECTQVFCVFFKDIFKAFLKGIFKAFFKCIHTAFVWVSFMCISVICVFFIRISFLVVRICFIRISFRVIHFYVGRFHTHLF